MSFKFIYNPHTHTHTHSKDQDPFLAGVRGIEWKRPADIGDPRARPVVRACDGGGGDGGEGIEARRREGGMEAGRQGKVCAHCNTCGWDGCAPVYFAGARVRACVRA